MPFALFTQVTLDNIRKPLFKKIQIDLQNISCLESIYFAYWNFMNAMRLFLNKLVLVFIKRM